MATMVAISGTASTPDMMPMLLMPIRMPSSATRMGRLIATSEPKATASTTTATRMPSFSLPGSASPGQVTEATVVLHLDARVADALNSLLGGVVLRYLERFVAIGHRCEGGVPVLAHGWPTGIVGVAHADDVRTLFQLGDGLRHGGFHRRRGQALVGVQDDVGGVEGLLGETVLERVCRTLRLGTRQLEALVGRTTDAPVEHECGNRDQDPSSEYAPRVAP